jgi:hypothetical protein
MSQKGHFPDCCSDEVGIYGKMTSFRESVSISPDFLVISSKEFTLRDMN